VRTAFEVNGAAVEVEATPDMPLLWVLREQLGLTGTKYGCGIGLCGACTVHLDGTAVRSCSVPVSACAGRKVGTIEGLRGARAEALRAAWIGLQVPQCGYCQPGMLMAATALLERQPRANADDIARGLTNLCRCGTYPRIRAAVLQVAQQPVGSQ
jgi:isoquinoline 1-oxidoreductase alpha subunit